MTDLKVIFPIVFLLLVGGCKSEYTNVVSTRVSAVEIDDFSFLEGDWGGELEYLNYGDDETFVSLPTQATYTRDKDEIAYQFIFTEPNGTEIKRDGSIKIGKNNKVNFNGATHRVIDKSMDDEGGLMEIRMVRSGEDNDRKAQIEHLFKRDGKEISITRYVLLDGATDPFIRHTYTFQKKD